MRPIAILSALVIVIFGGAVWLVAETADPGTQLGCRPMLPGYKIWVCPTPTPSEVP